MPKSGIMVFLYYSDPNNYFTAETFISVANSFKDFSAGLANE
jgi:hypothetical protein